MTKKDEEKTLQILKPLEDINLDKLVNNYIKSDCNPYEAYKKTFNKQLWKTETIVKIAAEKFFNSIEMHEVYIDKIENLREVYKEEINLAFKTINDIMENDTYIHYDGFFDIKTGKVIPYSVKKSITKGDKLRAARLMLEINGYFETNKKDIQVINNKFNFIRNMENK